MGKAYSVEDAMFSLEISNDCYVPTRYVPRVGVEIVPLTEWGVDEDGFEFPPKYRVVKATLEGMELIVVEKRFWVGGPNSGQYWSDFLLLR